MFLQWKLPTPGPEKTGKTIPQAQGSTSSEKTKRTVLQAQGFKSIRKTEKTTQTRRCTFSDKTEQTMPQAQASTFSDKAEQTLPQVQEPTSSDKTEQTMPEVQGSTFTDNTEKTMPQIQRLSTRLVSSCQKLWEKELLLDCTIACAKGKVKAHKIVLSASSDFLLKLLNENPGDHPTLILDASVNCLEHLMNYLYYGTLPSEENTEFFQLADKLKLRGVRQAAREAARRTVAAAPAPEPVSPPLCRGLPAGSPPPPAPVPATVTLPRRRGRPRKTQQVVRSELSPLATSDEPDTQPSPPPAPPPASPPKEVNVKVVQTLAGTVQILRPQQAAVAAAATTAAAGDSPARLRLRPGLATAGIPERLFGTPGARPQLPAVDRAHTESQQAAAEDEKPGGAGSGADDADDPADTADQKSEPADVQTETGWETVLGLDSNHGPSYGQGGGDGAAVVSGTRGRPTRLTASSVQCGYCGKMCCNRQTLKVHRRIHTDERPYACPYPGCDKAFRQRIHLRRHVTCHDVEIEPRQFACQSCGRMFRHEANLRRHREQHEDGRTCTPPQPRGKLSRMFVCNLCEKKFVSQAAYDNHVRVHTNQRPFVCRVCHKGFKQKSHLTEHERIHSGQKPFKCAQCDLTFYNRSRFKMHKVQHVNEGLQTGKEASLLDPENKFPACPICFKRFINASNLRQHQRRHSSDKPHSCHICLSRFKLAKTLTKHLAAHASGAWPGPRLLQERRRAAQEEVEEAAAAAATASEVSVPLSETGEGVIILREEEDGSLTYVPGLQEADTDGRVVQVMLGDPESTKPEDQLMSEDALSSKWIAASVQPMLPADVGGTLPVECPPPGQPGPSQAAGDPAAAAVVSQPVLMETEHVDAGGE